MSGTALKHKILNCYPIKATLNKEYKKALCFNNRGLSIKQNM